MTTIDLTGLSPAKVLAGLYNAARPQGMGFLHYDPTPMTEEQASELLTGQDGSVYFDYLYGRVMKVRIPLGPDGSIDPWLYDRDNGEGAASAVIASLRESDPSNAVISATHEIGKATAANLAIAAMSEPTTLEHGVMTLGGAPRRHPISDQPSTRRSTPTPSSTRSRPSSAFRPAMPPHAL